jgi:hypothetical protein
VRWDSNSGVELRAPQVKGVLRLEQGFDVIKCIAGVKLTWDNGVRSMMEHVMDSGRTDRAMLMDLRMVQTSDLEAMGVFL